jgi:putative transposase
MSDDYPVKSLCEVLKVSRSGYYQWRTVPNSVRARQEALMQERIAQIHRASRGTYGSPRVAAVLRKEGHSIGRHRVARLMRETGLQGRQRRRYRAQPIAIMTSRSPPIASRSPTDPLGSTRSG